MTESNSPPLLRSFFRNCNYKLSVIGISIRTISQSYLKTSFLRNNSLSTFFCIVSLQKSVVNAIFYIVWFVLSNCPFKHAKHDNFCKICSYVVDATVIIGYTEVEMRHDIILFYRNYACPLIIHR